MLRIGQVVLGMAHSGTHRTNALAVHHLARVAVVPVLVHKLLLGQGKGAQLVLLVRLMWLTIGTNVVII